MKRDLTQGRAVEGDGFDARLAAWAAVIREDGVEPTRDLWPAISAALPERKGRGRRFPPARDCLGAQGWAGAALAATVLLAIGIGVTGHGPGERTVRGTPAPPRAAAGGPASTSGLGAARQGLQVVDAAFDELQAALRQSPDDPELTRLVMLIHHSRSRLLRLQADGGARPAQGGRG